MIYPDLLQILELSDTDYKRTILTIFKEIEDKIKSSDRKLETLKKIGNSKNDKYITEIRNLFNGYNSRLDTD